MLDLKELDRKIDDALSCNRPSPQFIENIKTNARKLIKSLGDINLTDSEIKTLIWLSSWESETISNIESIFKKMSHLGDFMIISTIAFTIMAVMTDKLPDIYKII